MENNIGIEGPLMCMYWEIQL